MKGLPKRSNTHRIDTAAMRRFISSLPNEWIVRETMERDYGIDLTLEFFDGDTPSGQIVFIQIKGSESPFRIKNEKIRFPLKVKTLRYSELFSIPFFLLIAPIDKKLPMYFCHLQKYISFALDPEDANWREQESKTIYIPEINNFETNIDKFNRISESESFHHESVKFISQYWFWEYYIQYMKSFDFRYIDECIACLRKILRLNNFLQETQELSRGQIISTIEQLSNYHGNESQAIDYIEAFDQECMQPAYTRIIGKEEIERFIAEETGELPY